MYPSVKLVLSFYFYAFGFDFLADLAEQILQRKVSEDFSVLYILLIYVHGVLILTSKEIFHYFPLACGRNSIERYKRKSYSTHKKTYIDVSL